MVLDYSNPFYFSIGFYLLYALVLARFACTIKVLMVFGLTMEVEVVSLRSGAIMDSRLDSSQPITVQENHAV